MIMKQIYIESFERCFNDNIFFIKLSLLYHLKKHVIFWHLLLMKMAEDIPSCVADMRLALIA